MLDSAHELGLDCVRSVRSVAITFLQSESALAEIRRLVEVLLVDPVIEEFSVREGMDRAALEGPAIEVHFLPGVMDPVALSIQAAAREVLERMHNGWGRRILGVQTARGYQIEGPVSDEQLDALARGALANSCIQKYFISGTRRRDELPQRFPSPPEAAFRIRTVAIRDMDGDALAKLSREAHLFLSVAEMEAIQRHFASIGRDPTDLELETLAQTWSEHCVHKTLKSEVVYRGAPMGSGFGVMGSGNAECGMRNAESEQFCDRSEQSRDRKGAGSISPERGTRNAEHEGSGLVEIHYDNLLKDTIAKATRTVNKPWCLSVFIDNAGVISFDDEYGVAFKVETHNHPSAIEPYGGAATGVGGCVRDIMGCGLGAKPIANTDVFCLAPPDWPAERLPQGVLHPRRVLRGVVAGVRDYGNCMGIPTVNGAFHFDDRYLANPLVFCGCIGLIPRNRVNKAAKAGDLIVLAGGRTGRDGIHGATFSSAELTDTHADEFSHAVQIGNPIEEKKLLDAMLIARDHPNGCLYSAVTDCGAGGLSSAVGEMGAELGAEVDLDRVPLKYSGLRYDEVWISEAQERMVFAVPADRIQTFQRTMADEEVETTVIGRFTGDGILTTKFRNQVVGQLDMKFLHDGLPKLKRTAHWLPLAHQTRVQSSQIRKSTIADDTGLANIRDRLRVALSSGNVASKEFAIRMYDHEVQGGSVIKPLVGRGAGPSDAAVLRPRLDSYRGVVVGCGLCPQNFDDDPYWMAVAALDEAVRNVVCVGADLDHTALLDNFCWGGCHDDLSMGTLVRTCQGAHDAAVAYGLPFISGKDSLNNQFSQSKEEAKRTGLPERWAIPGTLLISALSVMPDVRKSVTMDLKRPGNHVILTQCSARKEGLEKAARFHKTIADAIVSGKVVSAHDVSDGGILVALAEMAIAGGMGVRARRPFGMEPPFENLMGAYLLEVSDKVPWDPTQLGIGFAVLATVTEEHIFEVNLDNEATVTWSLAELDQAWRGR